MEPVRGTPCFPVPRPISSPPPASLPSSPTWLASSKSSVLVALSHFPPRCHLPPSPLVTLPLLLPPHPHALHICLVSLARYGRFFITYLRHNETPPDTAANRRDAAETAACGAGQCAVALGAATAHAGAMSKALRQLWPQGQQALEIAEWTSSHSQGEDRAGTIVRPSHWGGGR